MAYNPMNLSALAYSNGFTLWHYRTANLPAAVLADGYFNHAAAMLRTGDFVLVNAGLGDTPKTGVIIVGAVTYGETDGHELGVGTVAVGAMRGLDA